VHEFNEAGLIPAIVDPIWNVNMFLNENSLLGQLLQILFGYNGNPSLTEMIAYFAYLIVVGILWRRSNTIPVKSTATSQA
jgi:high-affinity iron transporter